MLLMDRLKLGPILACCHGVTQHKIVFRLFQGRSEVTLTLETSPGGWRASPRSLQGYSGPVPGSPAMEGGEVVTCSWVERDKVLGQREGGSLGVSGRVTKSSGEELINVKGIIRLEIRTCEADTYVKVGWLPGWRRRRRRTRERERETGQQQ